MNFFEMQNEILNVNRSDIFNKYLKLFRDQLSIPTRNICVGEHWLRGRSHHDKFKVSFDDYDTDIKIPYFKKKIGVPPIEIPKSNRFNRGNTAYLYLTSDLNTCVGEIRLKENEICSISEFSCVRNGTYVDVISMFKIPELKPLARILTRTIGDKKRIYEITQFISDIFKEIGYSGILYPSARKSNGLNLVCFYPDYFEFVIYSDRIYKGVPDESGNIILLSQREQFKRYPEYRKEMYSFGDTPEKEEAFEYIEDKICFEDEQEYISSVRNICDLNNTSEIECALNSFVEYFSRGHLRKKAYQFRGAYYINAGKSEIGIKDYILSLNACKAKWNTVIDRVTHDIFNSNDVDNVQKTEGLKQKIIEECNLYFQESDKRWNMMMEELKKLDS